MKALQIHHSAVARKRYVPPGGAPVDFSPYLVEEDFEDATDYDMTGQWTESGAPDPNYTPALEGSESLRLTSSANTRVSFTPTSAVTACFMMRLGSSPAEYTPPIYLYDQFGNPCAGFERIGTKWVIFHGGSSSTGTDDVIVGSACYFWLEWSKSTGSDGVVNLYISTNTTKPGSPAASLSNGTFTDDAGRLQLLSPAVDAVFDHVRVKAGAPGTVTAWPL